MEIQWIEVMNQKTGERGRISRGHLENPSIVPPGLLVEVDPDQKPYLSDMFQDRTVPTPAEAKIKKADKPTDEED